MNFNVGSMCFVRVTSSFLIVADENHDCINNHILEINFNKILEKRIDINVLLKNRSFTKIKVINEMSLHTVDLGFNHEKI